MTVTHPNEKPVRKMTFMQVLAERSDTIKRLQSDQQKDVKPVEYYRKRNVPKKLRKKS